MRRRKKRIKGKPCFILKNTPFGTVVFLGKDRRGHLDKHPELESPEFIRQVQQTLKNPEDVRRSLINPRDVFVVYNKMEPIDNPLTPQYNYRYIKVVLGMKYKLKRVLSAWGMNFIKEKVKVKI